MEKQINPALSLLIDDTISHYDSPVEIYEGLEYSQKETVKRIFFYSQSRYVDSQVDEVGRRKPFRNIVNQVVDDETTNTDPDIKNIKFKAIGFAERTLLLRRYFLDWVKTSKFSLVLNELNEINARYGGVIAKKTIQGGELYIEPVQWSNVVNNQTDINKGLFIEKHTFTFGELEKKRGVWENIDEAKKLARKSTSSELKENSNIEQVEIYEIKGEAPTWIISEGEKPEKEEYSNIHAFIATDGKTKVQLYAEVAKDDNYKYYKRKRNSRPGRALGLGVVEEGFEAQVSTNEVAISEASAFALGSKTFAKTNSTSLAKQNLGNLSDGHIFELEEGETFEPVMLSPSMMMEFNNLMDKWEQNYRNNANVLSTNTEAKASVPFRSLALTTKLSAGGSDYRKENFEMFIGEIIWDWVLPFLVKKINKKSILEMEFTPTELQAFDESFSKVDAMNRANDSVKQMILNGEPVTSTTLDEKYKEMMGVIQSTNARRLEIPKGYFDNLMSKMTILLGNELEDVESEMQSLYEMWSSMAPEDPNKQIIWEQMVELGGVVSPASMIKTGQPQGQVQQQQTKQETTPSIVKGISSLIPSSTK